MRGNKPLSTHPPQGQNHPPVAVKSRNVILLLQGVVRGITPEERFTAEMGGSYKKNEEQRDGDNFVLCTLRAGKSRNTDFKPNINKETLTVYNVHKGNYLYGKFCRKKNMLTLRIKAIPSQGNMHKKLAQLLCLGRYQLASTNDLKLRY